MDFTTLMVFGSKFEPLIIHKRKIPASRFFPGFIRLLSIDAFPASKQGLAIVSTYLAWYYSTLVDISTIFIGKASENPEF